MFPLNIIPLAAQSDELVIVERENRDEAGQGSLYGQHCYRLDRQVVINRSMWNRNYCLLS